MGGIGSGRHYCWDIKNTTDSYRIIDIRDWHRQKLFIPNQSFIAKWAHNNETALSIRVDTEPQRIMLSYHYQKSNNDRVELNYPIYLSWTSCHYGNKRLWFLCPIKGCGKRVAILYEGKIFGCRRCCQLVYQSQREDVAYRALRRAEKICKMLNIEHDFIDCERTKPKGMHWKTFKKLVKNHHELMAKGNAYMADKVLLDFL